MNRTESTLTSDTIGLGALPSDRDLDWTAGIERDRRNRPNRLIGRQIEVEALENHRHNEAHLLHGEVHADALVWPINKRKIRPLRSVFRALGRKAIDVKNVRLLPEFRMPVRGIGAKKHG